MCRFDYYNIGMRPRQLQRDRRQLVAHLELDQLLAVQRPSAVRDLTVRRPALFCALMLNKAKLLRPRTRPKGRVEIQAEAKTKAKGRTVNVSMMSIG